MPIQTKLACGGLILLGLLSLAGGCQRGGEAEEKKLDFRPIKETDPSAEAPKTNFPLEWQQPDKALNDFILRVLDTCARGDYDTFCQLLAITETPPSHDNFTKIWHVLGDITVRSVRSDGKTPPTYYVHAIAKLRKPDARKRTELDLVLRAFKEMDQWRVAAAPKEITHKILVADSQPASEPAQGRPKAEAGHSAAPPAGSTVYKQKHQGS